MHAQRVEPRDAGRAARAHRAAPPPARRPRRTARRARCSARTARCVRRRCAAPASRACSSGRNTLTSPALGFSVPTKATTSSGQNDEKPAKPRPVAAISSAAPRSSRRGGEAVAPGADRERRERRAEQRRGADEADLERGRAEREQVGRQQHRHAAVAEGAQRARQQHRPRAASAPAGSSNRASAVRAAADSETRAIGRSCAAGLALHASNATRQQRYDRRRDKAH